MIRKLSFAGLAILAATLLAACSSSMVKSPAADNIKTIAVVGMSINRDIYITNLKGKSKSFTKNQKGWKKLLIDSAYDKDQRVAISTHALAAYSDALNSIPNWSVVPQDEVMNNAAFQEYYGIGLGTKVGKTLTGLIKGKTLNFYITPEGMVSQSYAKTNKNKKRAKKLGELATNLGVDAVAVIELDVAYELGFWGRKFSFNLARNRKGTPSISYGAVIINSAGEYAVVTPEPIRGDSDERHTASDSAMIIDGAAMLTDKAESLFKEAIDNSANHFALEISNEISN